MITDLLSFVAATLSFCYVERRRRSGRGGDPSRRGAHFVAAVAGANNGTVDPLTLQVAGVIRDMEMRALIEHYDLCGVFQQQSLRYVDVHFCVPFAPDWRPLDQGADQLTPVTTFRVDTLSEHLQNDSIVRPPDLAPPRLEFVSVPSAGIRRCAVGWQIPAQQFLQSEIRYGGFFSAPVSEMQLHFSVEAIIIGPDDPQVDNTSNGNQHRRRQLELVCPLVLCHKDGGITLGAATSMTPEQYSVISGLSIDQIHDTFADLGAGSHDTSIELDILLSVLVNALGPNHFFLVPTNAMKFVFGKIKEKCHLPPF